MIYWQRMDKTNPEFDAFTDLVDRALAVPRSMIQKRMEEHRKQSAQNPRRRGPKRKITSFPSDPAFGAGGAATVAAPGLPVGSLAGDSLDPDSPLN